MPIDRAALVTSPIARPPASGPDGRALPMTGFDGTSHGDGSRPEPARVRPPAKLSDADDAGASRFGLDPLVATLRWCALMLGTVFAAAEAADGNVRIVWTMSVVLFLTSWRTFRPLPFGDTAPAARVVAVTDAAVLGVALGFSDGLESPFVFCLVVAVGVAALGWGVLHALLALGAGTAATTVSAVTVGGTTGLGERPTAVLLASLLALVLVVGAIRSRLADAEHRRRRLVDELDVLTETNDLLQILNRVARTLPSSLDLRQALETSRRQLADTFDATTIALVAPDDAGASWSPLLADGCAFDTSVDLAALPRPLRRALDAGSAVLEEDLAGDGLGARSASGSGLYTALRARGNVVGLLAIEHHSAGRYGERDLQLLGGLADALALTIDNARRFRRLRALGAEEERSRIARDLHDRLGQWLTYISIELERIMSIQDEPSPDLGALHDDVQTAIEELRETLRQLRAGVTTDAPFATVGGHLVERFSSRTGISSTFAVHADEAPLGVRVENEVLRILQEALNNVERHARATHVDITWAIVDRVGTLTITDNGTGFDPSTGVRESAYGLVGMRERAEVIDARLAVRSSPGQGTTIQLVTAREENPA